jgi:hypothetical protein
LLLARWSGSRNDFAERGCQDRLLESRTCRTGPRLSPPHVLRHFRLRGEATVPAEECLGEHDAA